MDSIFEELVSLKQPELDIYSPYRFLRKKIDPHVICEETFIKPLLKEIRNKSISLIEIIIRKEVHFFICRFLKWDTDYFDFPVYRVELVLYTHNDLKTLTDAVNRFLKENVRKGEYIFINVPAEEGLLIQALSLAKIPLVESRLNYSLSDIEFYNEERFSVRIAGEKDIPDLKKIAIESRNRFDRVHVDAAFSQTIADNYLGTFAEESVRGFADVVIVPDINGTVPFGFLAANYPQDIMGYKVSKLVLAAVDNSKYKGWLFKLLSEMIYILQAKSADYLTTITQAANRPAIRTWEKAGFHLEFVTHVFSIRKR